MLEFLANKLYYTFASSQRIGLALKEAAVNGDIEQVKGIIVQSGIHITAPDKENAVLAAYDKHRHSFTLEGVNVIAILLTNIHDLRAFQHILEGESTRLDSQIIPPLLSFLPPEYYHRLSLEPTPSIVRRIAGQLIRAAESNDVAFINTLLNFDNHQLMQWAVDSNRVHYVESFIKIGVNYSIRHNGKTALDIAKERAQTDIVKTLMMGIGENAKISEAEWQLLLQQEDEQLRQNIHEIASKQHAHQIVTSAQAALQPSGLLLSAEQLQVVEEYFSDPRKYKYPKDKVVPFSVVKSQEGELIAIYNGKSVGFKDNLIGKGLNRKVKYGQILKSNQWCAVKIFSQVLDAPTIEDEALILKSQNNYSGIRGIQRDNSSHKYYLFMPFIPGLPFSIFYQEIQSNLSTRHQAKLFLQLLLAIQDLCKRKINHGDYHGGNVLLNPDDLSLTFIDFGRAKPIDEADAKSAIFSQLTNGIQLMEFFIKQPELQAIYNRLNSANENTLAAIDQGLIDIQAVFNKASELPAECVLQPPPVLASAPLKREAVKRVHDDISKAETTETADTSKRSRKQLQ